MKIENKNPDEWKRIIETVERMRFGEVVIKVQNGRIYISEYTVKRKPNDNGDRSEDALFTMEI